jgi:hypothetical protein
MTLCAAFGLIFRAVLNACTEGNGSPARSCPTVSAFRGERHLFVHGTPDSTLTRNGITGVLEQVIHLAIPRSGSILTSPLPGLGKPEN